jgi:hypothetical protein
MEENKRVYICDVDYLYKKEADEFEKFTGGAVYVFVRAFDVRDAVQHLEEDMKLRSIEPREIVSISPYNVEQEWANEEEQTHYLHLYVECEKVNPVVYDDFMAYERGE